MSCRSCLAALLTVAAYLGGIGQVGAQPTIAVLPVNFGHGSAGSLSRELTASLEQAHGADCISLIGPSPSASERYETPRGVNLEWISLEVVRGENAYYEAEPEEAIAILSQEGLVSLWDRTADMGARPEFAAIIRRGILALARVHFQLGDNERSAETIRESLRRFPLWTPSLDWYQPEFVEHYIQVREEFALDLPLLTIQMPSPDCTASLNGQEIETTPPVQVPLARGSHAVVVQCGNRRSLVHMVSSQQRRSIYINPRFDEVWSPDSGELMLTPDQSHDPVMLAPLARAYGDLFGADQVILVGWVEPSNAQRMMQIAVYNAPEESLEYAFRAPSGSESGLIVAALGSAGDVDGAYPFTSRGWLRMDGAKRGRNREVVGWGLVGLGGIALTVGIVSSIFEASAYSDFLDCDADPVCRNSNDLLDYRQSGHTATALSWIGFSVGLAASIAGTVLLLLEGDAPAPVQTSSSHQRFGPTLAGMTTRRSVGVRRDGLSAEDSLPTGDRHRSFEWIPDAIEGFPLQGGIGAIIRWKY
ncbi:MAG: hypothetical protein JW797_06415 [Bradymonadales bacterium]|nr:hypothetical protein [Bradymonadales bacterium]